VSPPPQAIILGSSRSFSVNPNQIEQLWHYPAFNASLTGGRVQDYLAFLHYVSQIGKYPELLIINLAPEIMVLDDNRYAVEPDALLWDYTENNNPLYPLKSNFDRITRLLSKEQLETSLQVLKVQGQPIYYDYNFDANGMGHFNTTTLSADDLNPDKLALNAWVTRFAQFHSDEYGFDQLQLILELAKQQHILVIGYMPPYYPVLRDVLETRTEFTPNINYLTGQLDDFEKEYLYGFSTSRPKKCT